MWPIECHHCLWPWMTLKVIHRLQAFSTAIGRTFVQYFSRFQLTARSRGPPATAGLLVMLAFTSVIAYMCYLQTVRFIHQREWRNEKPVRRSWTFIKFHIGTDCVTNSVHLVAINVETWRNRKNRWKLIWCQRNDNNSTTAVKLSKLLADGAVTIIQTAFPRCAATLRRCIKNEDERGSAVELAMRCPSSWRQEAQLSLSKREALCQAREKHSALWTPRFMARTVSSEHIRFWFLVLCGRLSFGFWAHIKIATFIHSFTRRPLVFMTSRVKSLQRPPASTSDRSLERSVREIGHRRTARSYTASPRSRWNLSRVKNPTSTLRSWRD